MTICLPILMQQEQSGKSNRITMHELFFFFLNLYTVQVNYKALQLETAQY